MKTKTIFWIVVIVVFLVAGIFMFNSGDESSLAPDLEESGAEIVEEEPRPVEEVSLNSDDDVFDEIEEALGLLE